MRRPSSRTLRHVLLFGLIVFLQGLVFETGMRLYGGTEAAPVFQELFMQDARIGHRPRPGAHIRYTTSEFTTDIAINSSGVRGPELGPKAANERRILVLGDSIVMSVQVDQAQTFCQRLEDELNQAADDGRFNPHLGPPGTQPQARSTQEAPGIRPFQSPQDEAPTRNQAPGTSQEPRTRNQERQSPSTRPTYHVINGGVQGYGPVEEWLFFEHVVSAVQPDVVLVAVFVANDAIEALDSERKLLEPTGDQPLHAAARDVASRTAEDARNWARRAVRRSMVLQTLRMRYDAVKARLQDTPVAQRPLLTYLEHPPSDVDSGLTVARDAITKVADRAREMGARTGLVLVPARFQLDDADFGRLAANVEASGGRLERDAATDRFARALAPLGLPMLDLLPALRAQPDPVSLFFQENVHFTPRGHEVVAAALGQFLAHSGLVPRGLKTSGSHESFGH